jgi:hypothetical protein
MAWEQCSPVFAEVVCCQMGTWQDFGILIQLRAHPTNLWDVRRAPLIENEYLLLYPLAARLCWGIADVHMCSSKGPIRAEHYDATEQSNCGGAGECGFFCCGKRAGAVELSMVERRSQSVERRECGRGNEQCIDDCLCFRERCWVLQSGGEQSAWCRDKFGCDFDGVDASGDHTATGECDGWARRHGGFFRDGVGNRAVDESMVVQWCFHG